MRFPGCHCFFALNSPVRGLGAFPWLPLFFALDSPPVRGLGAFALDTAGGSILVPRYCYTGDPVATDLNCSLETALCTGSSIDFDLNATQHQVRRFGEIRSGPLDTVIAYANPTNAVIGPRTVVSLKQEPDLRIVVENGVGNVWAATDNVDTVASLVLLLVVVSTLLNLTHVDRYACEECYAGFTTAEELEAHCRENRPPPVQGRLAKWLRLPCDQGGQHAGLGCAGCYANFVTADALRAHQAANLGYWNATIEEFGLKTENDINTKLCVRKIPAHSRVGAHAGLIDALRITLGLVSAIIWTVATSNNVAVEAELDLGNDLYVLYSVFGIAVGMGAVSLYHAKCHGHPAYASMAYTVCEVLLLIALSYTIPKSYGELSTACLFLCGLGGSIRLGRAADEALFPRKARTGECQANGAVPQPPALPTTKPIRRAFVIYTTIGATLLLIVLGMVAPMLYTVEGIHHGVVLPVAFLLGATGSVAPLLQSLYIQSIEPPDGATRF